MKQILSLLLSLLAANASYAQSQTLSVLNSFHIQSGGGWDYIAVSPVTDNIYVSHGTQVNILNKATGDSTGVIKGTIGVHGIVFAPKLGKGFISNGKLNNIFVFDPKTNRVTDSIRAGENPDAMCYDAFSKKLVVGNGRSNDLTIIDAATNKVLATVPLGGKPEASVSDGKGKVFINIEDKNEVAVLSMATLKIVGRYPLQGGEEPAGLAMDGERKFLFVGCGNKKLIVLETATGKQRWTLPIGDHCDGVAADGNTAYASNGDGTLSIIRPTKTGYKADAIHTKRGARTIAVDPATHLIYLPTAEFEPQPADSKERPKMIPGTFEVLVVGQAN
jgi:YVTN family beta-propeller protein